MAARHMAMMELMGVPVLLFTCGTRCDTGGKPGWGISCCA